MAKQALFWKTLPNSMVQCDLCSHYCTIKEGELGKCAVRKNKNGSLVALNYGLVPGLAVDPIEKKPFYHFKPGSRVLSFGIPGCNFKCIGCQNWELSQAPRLQQGWSNVRCADPKIVVDEMIRTQSDGIAYTYSEPTIFFEFAYDCITTARKKSPESYHVFVSNGFFSKNLCDFLLEKRLLDAIRIDLKFTSQENYEKYCGARLKPVLENIEKIGKAKNGPMLEVINLIVPGWNDTEEDFMQVSQAVLKAGAHIPLHFSRFHPDYRAEFLPDTPEKTLLQAVQTAKKTGLQHVYGGNTNQHGLSNTNCPKCGLLLIERDGFTVLKSVLEKSREKKERPICPKCGQKIYITL